MTVQGAENPATPGPSRHWGVTNVLRNATPGPSGLQRKVDILAKDKSVGPDPKAKGKENMSKNPPKKRGKATILNIDDFPVVRFFYHDVACFKS